MLVTEFKLRPLPVLSVRASVFYITQECSCTHSKQEEGGGCNGAGRRKEMEHALRLGVPVECQWRLGLPVSCAVKVEHCRGSDLHNGALRCCFCLPACLPFLTAGSASEGSAELVFSLCGGFNGCYI